jgi:hypothetical protein
MEMETEMLAETETEIGLEWDGDKLDSLTLESILNLV